MNIINLENEIMNDAFLNDDDDDDDIIGSNGQ